MGLSRPGWEKQGEAIDGTGTECFFDGASLMVF